MKCEEHVGEINGNDGEIIITKTSNSTRKPHMLEEAPASVFGWKGEMEDQKYV
jgi:hypothetical protein